MPRDLGLESQNQKEHVSNTEEQNQLRTESQTDAGQDNDTSPPAGPRISLSPEAIESDKLDHESSRFYSGHIDEMNRETTRDSFNVLVQSLNSSHVDSCTVLEDLCFPPEERCSKEKFQYRLSQAGGIHLGLFTIGLESPITNAASSSESMPSSKPGLELFKDAPTAQTTPTITTLRLPPRKEILLGHIICTLSPSTRVQDQDMEMPSSWSSTSNNAGSTSSDDVNSPDAKGHKPLGRTLCIHSLAILPMAQRNGLGRLLMTSFIQRFKDAGVADRIALLAHEKLIPFYERLGFANFGKSEAKYAGGTWHDLVYTFPPLTRPPIPTLVRDEAE